MYKAFGRRTETEQKNIVSNKKRDIESKNIYKIHLSIALYG